MTKEELAAILNGRQYGQEVADHEMGVIKAAGLIVLFGESDDLLELRGAIYDEVGAYKGRSFVLFSYKDTYEIADLDQIKELEEARQQVAAEDSRDRGNVVKVVWGPKDVDATWLVTTPLPHAPFDILRRDRLFCRGLVIDVKDLR